MNFKLDSEVPRKNSKKTSKPKKFSVADKAARKVLGTFLKRIKRQESQKISPKVDDEHQKLYLRSKIKDVISKLTAFCKDSLEVPTVLNETSEILREVTKSLGVSSYIVDENSKYLTLNHKYKLKNEHHTVRYKIESGKTVAAYVARSQEFVMVDDVLGDGRFPDGVPTGGKLVKSVLCVPVLTTVDGQCIAVIELYRDVKQEPYCALDLQICVSMTGWMGAAIHQNNERLFLLKKGEFNNYLSSLVGYFFAEVLTFDKFVSDIINFAKLSVRAERGSFYVMEEEVIAGMEDEIVADVYEEGIDSAHYLFKKRNKQRFSKDSKGFAGYVARQGEMINVQDASNDFRFNKAAHLFRFLTKSVISVPIKGNHGVLGVLQLVNKLEEPCFTKQDETLLQGIAGYAYLACQHSKLNEKLKKYAYRCAGSQELLKIQMKPRRNELRFFRLFKKSDLPKGFFTFEWLIIGKEDQAPNYAVFMFIHLLGQQYFDYYKITEFILTVKKSYRNNPYHNFAHAFTVCHCMFNVLHRNKESFTELQVLALLIATICHDSDHIGFTNNFLDMTHHWLSQLYLESPLEHHHYDTCLLMMEGSGLLSNLNSSEYIEVNKLLKVLILATDLVQYFKNRSKIINLLKLKIFTWENMDHRLLFLGNLMTVCDVSGQCKPFQLAKKVTEGLYREFYNQGDVEKTLGFCPLPMMDREKMSTIPENQIQFLSLVCIPSVEILVAVFPNTRELLRQCMELKTCWTDIQAKKIADIWKIEECVVDPKNQTCSFKLCLN